MAECVSCGSWTQYGELCIRCRKERKVVMVEYDSSKKSPLRSSIIQDR